MTPPVLKTPQPQVLFYSSWINCLNFWSQLNGCHGEPATFVYCNMNKHMKFSPNVFRDWLEILQVHLLMLVVMYNLSYSLCLVLFYAYLEIHLKQNQTWENLLKIMIAHYSQELDILVWVASLNIIIWMLLVEFIANPYDNQNRVKDLCNVILDTPVYSGHTTNADALWGGYSVV